MLFTTNIKKEKLLKQPKTTLYTNLDITYNEVRLFIALVLTRQGNDELAGIHHLGSILTFDLTVQLNAVFPEVEILRLFCTMCSSNFPAIFLK